MLGVFTRLYALTWTLLCLQIVLFVEVLALFHLLPQLPELQLVRGWVISDLMEERLCRRELTKCCVVSLAITPDSANSSMKASTPFCASPSGMPASSSLSRAISTVPTGPSTERHSLLILFTQSRMLLDLKRGNTMLLDGRTIYSLDYIVGKYATGSVVHGLGYRVGDVR